MIKISSLLIYIWSEICDFSAALLAKAERISDAYFREQEESGDAWWW